MVFRLGREIRQFFYHKLNADTVTIALGLGWGRRSCTAGHYSSSSHFGVEAAELYWHFADGVWIIILILVNFLELK